jgi:hypothetical protein
MFLNNFIENILHKNDEYYNYQICLETTGINKKSFLVNAKKILPDKAGSQLIVLCFEEKDDPCD